MGPPRSHAALITLACIICAAAPGRVQSARSSPPPPSVAFSSGTCPSFWCSNCYTAANYKTGAALESSEAAALTGVSPYGGRRHLRQAELVPNVGCQAAVGVTATNTWSPFIGGTDAVTCQQSCSVYVVSGQVITLDATTGNGNQAVGIQAPNGAVLGTCTGSCFASAIATQTGWYNVLEGYTGYTLVQGVTGWAASQSGTWQYVAYGSGSGTVAWTLSALPTPVPPLSYFVPSSIVGGASLHGGPYSIDFAAGTVTAGGLLVGLMTGGVVVIRSELYQVTLANGTCASGCAAKAGPLKDGCRGGTLNIYTNQAATAVSSASQAPACDFTLALTTTQTAYESTFAPPPSPPPPFPSTPPAPFPPAMPVVAVGSNSFSSGACSLPGVSNPLCLSNIVAKQAVGAPTATVWNALPVSLAAGQLIVFGAEHLSIAGQPPPSSQGPTYLWLGPFSASKNQASFSWSSTEISAEQNSVFSLEEGNANNAVEQGGAYPLFWRVPVGGDGQYFIYEGCIDQKPAVRIQSAMLPVNIPATQSPCQGQVVYEVTATNISPPPPPPPSPPPNPPMPPKPPASPPSPPPSWQAAFSKSAFGR